MINRIKIGFKMLPYGYNFKLMSALGIVFYILGFVMLFVSDNAFLLGSLYLLLGPMYLLQVSSLLECSTMIASSPKRSIFYMTITDCIAIITGVVNYCIVFAYLYIGVINHPEAEVHYATKLILFGLCLLLLVLYMGLAFKKFIVSFLLFLIGFFSIYGFGERWISQFQISFPNAIIISICCGVAGIIVSHILRIVLKKAPIQSICVGRTLRKYL